MTIQTEWLTNGINQEAVDWANGFGQDLTISQPQGDKALTMTQLRKFYGKLKQIQADFENRKNEIPMLQVALAYAVGRDRNSKVQKLYEELRPHFNNELSNQNTFNNFVQLMEAVVAYHKFHGGK